VAVTLATRFIHDTVVNFNVAAMIPLTK